MTRRTCWPWRHQWVFFGFMLRRCELCGKRKVKL